MHSEVTLLPPSYLLSAFSMNQTQLQDRGQGIPQIQSIQVSLPEQRTKQTRVREDLEEQKTPTWAETDHTLSHSKIRLNYNIFIIHTESRHPPEAGADARPPAQLDLSPRVPKSTQHISTGCARQDLLSKSCSFLATPS